MKYACPAIMAFRAVMTLVAGCSGTTGVLFGPPGGGSEDANGGCGAPGEPCCNGTACNTGLTCVAAVCSGSTQQGARDATANAVSEIADGTGGQVAARMETGVVDNPDAPPGPADGGDSVVDSTVDNPVQQPSGAEAGDAPAPAVSSPDGGCSAGGAECDQESCAADGAGACTVSPPPSCLTGAPGTDTCGPGGTGTESCCTSLEVPAGTFDRTYSYDGGVATGLGDPASVSGFRLDKYLVTVARLRQYVAYLAGGGSPPANGSGKHTHLNGGQGLASAGHPGTFESGWDAADWNATIPTGAAAIGLWNANLTTACLTTTLTWTPTAGNDENLPVDCVDWYEAYAFCIWDGGFLPSEAEWEYAAAAGSQQRKYPWGITDPGSASHYAIYDCYYPDASGTCTVGPANLAPVGTATLGAGLWGQLDLSGEVYEWTFDWYATYVNPCVDCANLSSNQSRVLRGGQFGGTPSHLQPVTRSSNTPLDRHNDIGFRCARAP
jgi:sulfatase modifying factor 1